GIDNIQHYLMTTQEFVETEYYKGLNETGIVFIDGLHTKEQAKFDYQAFKEKIPAEGIIMFHDSIHMKWSKKIYGPGKEYQTDVKIFMDELKLDSCLQVLDLPFAVGLSLVKKI
ncbi:MAG: class I SAM-dependent methyltransferase, partial [Gammaproteobacteria bacterium]